MVGAVGQHEGRLAGIGRRRDPGVEACIGALGQRPEAEGGGQPVGRTVADDDGEHEHAEQQQGAQRIGVQTIGARLRAADAQLLQHLGETRAVHPPQRRRARILGAQRQRILVGGGRTMLDAGHALDAADRLLARGRPHANQRQPARRRRPGRTAPARSCAAARAGRGHRPAIDTAMNSPARPSSIQARGHSRSNWSAHWLRRTFRSKALSSAEGDVCRAAIDPNSIMRRSNCEFTLRCCAKSPKTLLIQRGCGANAAARRHRLAQAWAGAAAGWRKGRQFGGPAQSSAASVRFTAERRPEASAPPGREPRPSASGPTL